MKLRGLIPMLETNDLKASIKFYSETLGFTCDGVFPSEENFSWASLSKDDVIIMLTARSPHSNEEKAVMTGSLYMYPDDVDEAWYQLKDKAEVSYEIENFDYGMREFGILDPNGYLLQFGQDIKEEEENAGK